jgi:hypothetical protein
MIEISNLKAKLADLTVLSQKNRQPDENPGAKLSIEATLPLDTLAMFDGRMRSAFWEAKPSNQGAIDGLAVEQLNALGEHTSWVTWSKEYTGHTLTVDLGLGGPSNLTIADCRLYAFRFKPEAGAIFAKFKVESADISEALFGKLAKLKSCEITISIEPPEVAQQELDDTPPAAEKKGKAAKVQQQGDGTWPFPKKDATDAFVDAHA